MDIVARQNKSKEWQIYLHEERKGRVSLSASGNGVKTVILVLCYVHLVTSIQGKELSDYVFSFEEIENNLHPALQRRLLTYLRRLCLDAGSLVFLTTHSNIAIDYFSHDKEAPLLHVVHNGYEAQLVESLRYADHKRILDDLDVRASDLLQANCIVWVEGPSDRVYFNRWIEILTSGFLREGAHYQVNYYGGKLLAHFSAAPPESEDDQFVQILKINRNAILLADRDTDSADEVVTNAKQRVIKEVQDNGGVAWLTHGREIENYLSSNVIQQYFGRGSYTTSAPFKFSRITSTQSNMDLAKNSNAANQNLQRRLRQRSQPKICKGRAVSIPSC